MRATINLRRRWPGCLGAEALVVAFTRACIIGNQRDIELFDHSGVDCYLPLIHCANSMTFDIVSLQRRLCQTDRWLAVSRTVRIALLVAALNENVTFPEDGSVPA